MDNATIQDWIMDITGYDNQHVIEAYQEGPRPVNNYATYYRLTGNTSIFSEAEKEDLLVNDDIKVTYRSPKITIFSVDVFADDGEQILADLGQSKNLLAIRLILQADNAVLRSKSDTRFVPTPGDTRWRRHWQADFTFAEYHESTEENQKILEYEITGEIGGLETTIDV